MPQYSNQNCSIIPFHRIKDLGEVIEGEFETTRNVLEQNPQNQINRLEQEDISRVYHLAEHSKTHNRYATANDQGDVNTEPKKSIRTAYHTIKEKILQNQGRIAGLAATFVTVTALTIAGYSSYLTRQYVRQMQQTANLETQTIQPEEENLNAPHHNNIASPKPPQSNTTKLENRIQEQENTPSKNENQSKNQDQTPQPQQNTTKHPPQKNRRRHNRSRRNRQRQEQHQSRVVCRVIGVHSFDHNGEEAVDLQTVRQFEQPFLTQDHVDAILENGSSRFFYYTGYMSTSYLCVPR